MLISETFLIKKHPPSLAITLHLVIIKIQFRIVTLAINLPAHLDCSNYILYILIRRNHRHLKIINITKVLGKVYSKQLRIIILDFNYVSEVDVGRLKISCPVRLANAGRLCYKKQNDFYEDDL